MSGYYLIHLPHCGTEIPEAYIGDYLLDPEELRQNVYEYCDLYTDELFEDLYRRFGGVKSEYSRLFFDPERFGDDALEEMHRKHRLGWFYENAILAKKPLRKTSHKEKIRAYYEEHHRALNELTAQKLARYGRCTLIDCHSFSNRIYWFLDKNMEFPDICIGFEEAHVDEELVEKILEIFDGYEIAINSPYEGALVPTDYWHRDSRVKSVMVEINKRLYLDSDNLTKNAGFHTVRRKLTTLSEILAKG